VIQQLKQSKSPFLLGIWGMPGIGKSTIAQAIYDQIGPYFEHKCLHKNMEENDKVSLQQKLLFHIHKLTGIEIPTIGSVSEILKEKLQHKRLLLVLDDVDKEQLKALCEIWDWFGPGSKIIIATTDRHLLKEYGVDHIYPVNELDESESLELFNWCVFSEATTPPEDFVELSRQMVAYSAGLPLALTALGRFLCQKDVLQWKGVLSSLKRFSFPVQEVLEALKMGFDALSDEEKQIFLDIACFFNGMDKNNVLHRLNKSTQSTALHISLLEDKSLLTIDENNKLQVHVLLQAMARYIIKRESSNFTNQVHEW
jgi:adenylate kinase family enzyme